jgi:isoquinoline 1-oxidoreductase beta subunit
LSFSALKDNMPVVHRVVAGVDCGQVVNPGILEQQVQGAAVFALSAALRGKISIDKGGIVETNFDSYQPLRMNECPAVEVHTVASNEPPTGIGEPPVPPLAAAPCNALFVATRKRVRTLPLAR